MNDPRESIEGAPLAPLLGTPKAAYSNVPKRLGSCGSDTLVRRSCRWFCVCLAACAVAPNVKLQNQSQRRRTRVSDPHGSCSSPVVPPISAVL